MQIKLNVAFSFFFFIWNRSFSAHKDYNAIFVATDVEKMFAIMQCIDTEKKKWSVTTKFYVKTCWLTPSISNWAADSYSDNDTLQAPLFHLHLEVTALLLHQ